MINHTSFPVFKMTSCIKHEKKGNYNYFSFIGVYAAITYAEALKNYKYIFKGDETYKSELPISRH